MKRRYFISVSSIICLLCLFLFVSCNKEELQESIDTAYNLALNTSGVLEEQVLSKTVEKTKSNIYIVSLITNNETYRYSVDVKNKECNNLESFSSTVITNEIYNKSYEQALVMSKLNENDVLKCDVSVLSSDTGNVEVSLYTASNKYYFSYNIEKNSIDSSKVDEINILNESYEEYINKALEYLHLTNDEVIMLDVRTSISKGDKVYKVFISTNGYDYFVTINSLSLEVIKLEANNQREHIMGDNVEGIHNTLVNKFDFNKNVKYNYIRSSFYRYDKAYEISFDLNNFTYELIVESTNLEILKIEKYDVNYYKFYSLLYSMNNKKDFGKPEEFETFEKELDKMMPGFDLSKYYPLAPNLNHDRNLVVAKVLSELEISFDKSLSVSVNLFVEVDGSMSYFVSGTNNEKYFEASVDSNYNVISSKIVLFEDILKALSDYLNVEQNKLSFHHIFKDKDSFVVFGKYNDEFIEAKVDCSTFEVTLVNKEKVEQNFITKEKALSAALKRFLFAENQVTVEQILFVEDGMGRCKYIVKYYDNNYIYTVEVDAVSGRVFDSHKEFNR